VRFLADESCDFGVVRALRNAGHDVRAVVEDAPGATDAEVAADAAADGRVLLTEDKDFGRLVFSGAGPGEGVVFIRFPGNARQALAESMVEAVDKLGDRLAGGFAVVEPGRIRIVERI
jgi:predicted nuclease of predicted toxin-antitoxin system